MCTWGGFLEGKLDKSVTASIEVMATKVSALSVLVRVFTIKSNHYIQGAWERTDGLGGYGWIGELGTCEWF